MSVGAAGKMGPVPGVWPRPEPFAPRADPAVLEDLRARLRATRWPDAPEDAGWSLGTDLDYLRELVAYWADEFDWTAQEAALARLPRYRVRLGGLRIHFVHARAAQAGPVLPLVLTHGWPDSFWRYTKVIGLLTDPAAHGADPADAFDVIVPDIPGFGYSDRPPGPPLDAVAVAGLWAELMTILGYPRFGAAGGDIGSQVSRYLALDHPDRVAAVHRTDGGAGRLHRRPGRPGPRGTRLPPARRRLERHRRRLHRHAGHQTPDRRVRAHRLPRRARRLDRGELRTWSDNDGDIEQSFTKDEILTNLTIYWLTATIGSSIRMYHANAQIPATQHTSRVEVPSGFSLFADDIHHPPRAWLERTANLVRLTEPPRGGHFAAFEEPELYAEELRAFFRPYRTPAH